MDSKKKIMSTAVCVEDEFKREIEAQYKRNDRDNIINKLEIYSKAFEMQPKSLQNLEIFETIKTKFTALKKDGMVQSISATVFAIFAYVFQIKLPKSNKSCKTGTYKQSIDYPSVREIERCETLAQAAFCYFSHFFAEPFLNLEIYERTTPSNFNQNDNFCPELRYQFGLDIYFYDEIKYMSLIDFSDLNCISNESNIVRFFIPQIDTCFILIFCTPQGTKRHVLKYIYYKYIPNEYSDIISIQETPCVSTVNIIEALEKLGVQQVEMLEEKYDQKLDENQMGVHIEKPVIQLEEKHQSEELEEKQHGNEEPQFSSYEA